MAKSNNHRCRQLWASGIALWFALLTGIGSATAAPLEQGRLSVAGDHVLEVEIARTAQERSRGLMERDRLAADAGMLFLYETDQPASSAYWMYRTRIPLDIAFVDDQGVIRSLKTMAPCRSTTPSECPAYPSGAAFRAALETNAGYFDEHGIGVGDRIELAPWLESRQP
ncbi:DUF192 domain-containing protein [Salinicola rhizosphaerae]|uniref:DUF192 domain-containing protein n=1 Tax=Salinicola rhizosphaerae TaxID=1443141 RepID=A0ABQ3DZZ4_9GAMM|nr:DUF192 domain-containing protein [Salinicola rhizosphaerae]GHB19368.1 hypothetical protein GCM10009038_17550 [Salinicola rhizosphaerae]